MIDIRVGRLADLLGVHRNTVFNWIRCGKLPVHATVGRRYLIDEEELCRFFSRHHLSQAILSQLGVPTAPADEPGRANTHKNPIARQQEVSMTDKVIGSVMVVGGGIAGIQATLDLASAGYYVHLVEKSAGIGGVMAQLDKTYPTNDCAM
jgi:excisionase family DNA binding protein